MEHIDTIQERNRALGHLIKKIRTQKKITITTCIEQIGTSRRRYMSMENGDATIGAAELAVLAKLFDYNFFFDIGNTSVGTNDTVQDMSEKQMAQEDSLNRLVAEAGIDDTQKEEAYFHPLIPDILSEYELKIDNYDEGYYKREQRNEDQIKFLESIDEINFMDRWVTKNGMNEKIKAIENEVFFAQQGKSIYDENQSRPLKPLIFRALPLDPTWDTIYSVKPEQLKGTLLNQLYSGNVIASGHKAFFTPFDTRIVLRLSICLASYWKGPESWQYQLFNRDVDGEYTSIENPEFFCFQIDGQLNHDEFPQETTRLKLRLGRNLAYAERYYALQDKEKWFMGRGSPAPPQLLYGSTTVSVLERNLEILRSFILNHPKFVFVAPVPTFPMVRLYEKILKPCEFVVIDTLREKLFGYTVQSIRQGVKWLHDEERVSVLEFMDLYGTQIVRGMYRLSNNQPCAIFYAHKNFFKEAALIAMAASVEADYAGFPLLLKQADSFCSQVGY